jgi:hypothetical protein
MAAKPVTGPTPLLRPPWLRHDAPGFGATWTESVQAISAIATPILVAALAFYLTRRQDRSNELLKARIDYYNELAPDLNTLMCYLTFIGPWRDIPPPAIIELKRRVDQRFFCAAPLFTKLGAKSRTGKTSGTTCSPSPTPT